MVAVSTILIFLASFVILALASERIGRFFVMFKLPLISGFLFSGILVGPYVLGLISSAAIANLQFVDDISLAVIAFAAGSELHLSELRSRLGSITWITIANAVVVPIVGGLAIFLLADWIPFMASLSAAERLAVALVGGAILVARSPSSAIAIINEMRAYGPFTQMVLGVTMLTDVLVIILFAINSSIADTLVSNLSFDISFIFLLVGELLLSLGIGYGVGKLIELLLNTHLNTWLKRGGLLVIGYAVFVMSDLVRELSHTQLPFEIFLESLLICLIGAFYVTNYTQVRSEFLHMLEDIGPPIYVAFFTLTGAALQLDVLAATWTIAVALFVVRMVAIFLGSYGGGVLAREPALFNRLSWLTFITQAGVGLGLAKEAGASFPVWGESFATMIISVIVISQLAGPPFFKWAIERVGEAHQRAAGPSIDDQRIALIFGLESQSLALARILQHNGWQVTIATRQANQRENLNDSEVNIHLIAGLTLEAMQELRAEKADAIVTMLSNDENYQVCELAYEHFGTEQLIVRLTELSNVARFRALGAVVVDPSTALVNLMDHFVRSPAATSLLLDMQEGQRVAELLVRNPNLHKLCLRDLRLPLDVLILSINRNGASVISHGYTMLEIGDRVTVVGKPESLNEVALQFES